MKTSDLSVKELAAFIGVSTDTIRRAVRKGEIPATRVRTALRFDLHKVLTCMQRNAAIRFGGRSARAPALAGGAHSRNAPGLVTRGRYRQGSLQEFYYFYECPLHAHH